MGFVNSWRMEAHGYSRGIWVLWNTADIKVLHYEAMSQCVCILLENNNEALLLSCIYGATTALKRRELWSHLNFLSHSTNNIPWACIGDYNVYTSSDDKMEGVGPNLGSMADFVSCLGDCGLNDLGFNGPKFTWSNGHIHERIDRCVVNKALMDAYIDASLFHLNQLKSDHRPILL